MRKLKLLFKKCPHNVRHVFTILLDFTSMASGGVTLLYVSMNVNKAFDAFCRVHFERDTSIPVYTQSPQKGT